MENEILLQILANQVMLYKRIEDLEYRIKGSGMRSADLLTYNQEMLRKTEHLLQELKNPR